MPLYRWRCRDCGTTCEVLREVAEYENSPTESEVPQSSECDHNSGWQREISYVTVKKGDNWGGGKGNW